MQTHRFARKPSTCWLRLRLTRACVTCCTRWRRRTRMHTSGMCRSKCWTQRRRCNRRKAHTLFQGRSQWSGPSVWGLLRLVGFRGKENVLDRAVEETSDTKSKRKAGIEFAGFDGVDALAGNLQALGEVGLTPVTLSAQDAEAILHWYLRIWIDKAISAVMEKRSMLNIGIASAKGIRDQTNPT